MTRFDVAVVGLGIVGASATYALTRAGVRVIALDAGTPGAGTSGTSFAWLNAVRKEPEAYHRLNADGMAAHRELKRELGGDTGHQAGGSLEWADGGDAEVELRERVERLARRGYPAEWISRERARSLERSLAIPDHVPDVAFYAADAWLDVPRLIGRLLAGTSSSGAASSAASSRGASSRGGAWQGGASSRRAQIIERTAVTALRARDNRAEALVTAGGEIVAESFVVCVGPATQAFLAPLGVTIPVGRVPGLLAITSPPSEPLARVVHAPGVHLRPDASGGLMLGADDVDPLAAVAEPGKLDDLAALLLDRARRVFPAARDVKIVDRRVGVRPMPADRHTIAGRIPGFTNAWVIATHSGVTLGPLLGKLIAAEVVEGTPSAALAPFRPERFTQA